MKKLFNLPALVVVAAMFLFITHASAITFTNLYVFSLDGFTTIGGSLEDTNADGINPDSLILMGDTFYGTAFSGGAYGGGTFFRVNSDGTHFTNLLNFTRGAYNPSSGFYDGSTGIEPNPGLLLVSNTFYGTTFAGGHYDAGTVFKINPDGSGLSLLKESAFTNGLSPSSGLTLYNNVLYDTTTGGGTNLNAYGTVFEIGLNGQGFSNIYQFTNLESPYGGVAVSSNGVFGFTHGGGRYGDGYVYRVGGTGFADLFDFAGTNGWVSYATPTLSGNTLYGVTFQGGTNDAGNIFRIDTDGQNFTNLYNFSPADGANTDGVQPYELSGLILSGNTLYGTTSLKGSGGQGTVFKVSTSGTDYTVLHSFQYSDGAQPWQLVLSGGNLFGVAEYGNQGTSAGVGSIFQIILHPNLNLSLASKNAILSWNDPSYSLYTAPTLTSAFIKISGATSPYTNGLTGTQKYFELQ
jgi:uncharacterized repeat protein (TIGR03803 family)